MLKALPLLVLLMLFMDPCQVRPRVLKFGEVQGACNSGRYVKLSGFFQNRGKVKCADRPGGIHCELFFGESNEGEPSIPVFIVAGRDDLSKSDVIVPIPGQVEYLPGPFTANFHEIKLFDRKGKLVEHRDRSVDLLGSLRADGEGHGCSLTVLHIGEE